jgi:hypothetical protein
MAADAVAISFRSAAVSYDLVNKMLDDRQTQAPIQAKEWEAQLRESYDNLRQAQRQLREFIRSSFPLPD